MPPMHDLKAAAKRLRERLNPSGAKYVMVRDERRALAIFVEAQDNLLSAQALEAWAWQQETGAKVRECWTGHRWFCEVADGEYVADTPLGAVLAAMEGDRHD